MERKRMAVGTMLLTAVGAALIFAAAGSGAKSAPYKVAWIYPGPHNDGGWSQSHDDGRLYVQKKLGSAKVETTYKENIFSNAQVPQVVAGLARDGYQMIFGTSFQMFEAGNGQLYRKYPDVLFEQATGLQIKKNQSEYFGAGEDTIYLSGMAAGAASKKGLIGYVVPFGIPEVVRHINAFALGAQVDPTRREGEAHLDERVVLAAEGDRRGAEPDLGRRRRARTERRQPRSRRGGREEGHSVGRLRLGRAEDPRRSSG